MHYNTDEMNDLSYDLALYYDKRTFCKYVFNSVETSSNLKSSSIFDSRDKGIIFKMIIIK